MRGAFALFISCAIIVLSGCGHNTDILTLGTRVHLGIDPRNVTADIAYSDGLNISDISRENSGWVVEVNSETGLTLTKEGTVKGVKYLRRFIGPQFNGYLVDLAKSNPDLAMQYMKAVEAFWLYQAKVVDK